MSAISSGIVDGEWTPPPNPLFNDGKRIELKLESPLVERWRVEAWQEYSHAMSFELFDVNCGEGGSLMFSGSIKWDGCSNWNATALHFCEREQFAQFGQLLGVLWDYTEKNLPTFNP